jgi:voltage-gated potassium channel
MREKIYNAIIFVLCILAVLLAVVDFTDGLNPVLTCVDDIIYVIFVGDYIVRFVFAEKKKAFVKENVFDLIAIIPFGPLCRAFRLMKFARVFRFAKLFRVASHSARFLSRSKAFLNTNGFKYILCLTASSIFIATFAMMYFENMSFRDALWWSFVTATTVGYGDLSPATNIGRAIASLLMVVGIGLIGALTSSITSFFLHRDEQTQSLDSEKVDMVMTLYHKLSKEEKKAFLDELMKHEDSRDS